MDYVHEHICTNMEHVYVKIITLKQCRAYLHRTLVTVNCKKLYHANRMCLFECRYRPYLSYKLSFNNHSTVVDNWQRSTCKTYIKTGSSLTQYGKRKCHEPERLKHHAVYAGICTTQLVVSLRVKQVMQLCRNESRLTQLSWRKTDQTQFKQLFGHPVALAGFAIVNPIVNDLQMMIQWCWLKWQIAIVAYLSK